MVNIAVPQGQRAQTNVAVLTTRLVPRKRQMLALLARSQQTYATGAGRLIFKRTDVDLRYTSTRLVPRKRIMLNLLAASNLPAISGVSGMSYFGVTIISGANFGAAVPTVTIGGWPQTVFANSPTSITISSTFRGLSEYGVPVTVSVTNNSTRNTANFVYTPGFSPQVGWQYVNLTSVNTTAAYRLTATPDVAIGDQVAWGTVAPVGGLVTVNADATFETNALAQFFYFEVNDGTGWGPQALVTVVAVALLYTDLYVFIAQLINAGMMVQPNVNWITSSTVPYGKVISVVPVGGSVVNLWTYVTINASLGPAAGTTLNQVPNVVGQQAYDAERSCWNAQLDVGQRIYAFSNTVAAGYIIAQSVASGTLQPPGTSIQLTVSLGAQSTPTTTTIVPTILTH